MRAAALRALTTLAILLMIFAATRALVRALPGDPLETLVAESGTTVPSAQLRVELGLDRPFLPSLFQDLKMAAHGDLGLTLLSRQPVAPLLARRFKKTIALSALALLFALPISLWLGLAAAARPGSVSDRICTGYGAVTAALPTPWIGPLLLVVFAVWLPIFPVSESAVLPALTLALGLSGLWARLIRERVRDTLKYGSATGARARGIAEWKVVIKYGLAPASGALLAYLGTQMGGLLAGAFVTEVLFGWRGMGSLLVEAVLKRDYPIIESGTFVVAAAAFLGSILGDWLQTAVDPRTKDLL